MNDTLKAAGRIGAELGAAKAEVERLRGLLREAAEDVEAWGAYASEYFQEKHDLAGCAAKYRAAGVGDQGDGGAELAAIAAMPMRAALSQQAEPVAPAPAHDEREAAIADIFEVLTGHRDQVAWSDTCYSAHAANLYEAGYRKHRPAQTEQQPVAWECRCTCDECTGADWTYCSFEQYQMALADPDMEARELYAAPIAQTAISTQRGES